MKFKISNLALVLTFSTIMSVLNAQFDDLYYDPDRDGNVTNEYSSTSSTSYDDNDSYPSVYDNNEYAYDYVDDYDYGYSTRIRRFHRPSCSLSYYSPVFNSFYDPWYDPYYGYNSWYGNNSLVLYIGTPSWGWNRWSSWYRPYYGYNSWASCGSYGWNNYYGNSWYNGWNNHGYYGNGYNNSHWNNNHIVESHPNGTYYGSRQNSSTTSSTKGRKDGPRFTAPPTKPTTNDATFTMGDASENTPKSQASRGDVIKNSNANDNALSPASEDRPNTSQKSSIYTRKNSDVSRSYKSDTDRTNSSSQSTRDTYKPRNENRSEREATPSRSSSRPSSEGSSSSRGGSYTPSRSSNSSGSSSRSSSPSSSSSRSSGSSSSRGGGSSRRGG